MSKKSRGINAERELVHKFWSNGFIAMRAPGSGSIKYPCPDILVGNPLRKLAIECKTTRSDKQYISSGQIGDLDRFAKIFSAEPWVAVKFKGNEWLFISLEDLNQTKANNYGIKLEEARTKGLLFEELIQKIETSQPE